MSISNRLFERRKSFNKLTSNVTRVQHSETLDEWAIYCDWFEHWGYRGYCFVISKPDTSKEIPKIGDVVTILEFDSIIRRIFLNGQILWTDRRADKPKKLIFY